MFDWDSANIEHVGKHGVSPQEAEDGLLDARQIPRSTRPTESGELRWAVTGATEAGRILFIVFTRRRGLVRIVTARDATDHERRRYRKNR